MTPVVGASTQNFGSALDTTDHLFSALYPDLRGLAARLMTCQGPDCALEATALVHEAFLHLQGKKTMSWVNRAHFFRVVAEVMRRILIDLNRRRLSLRRGGGRQRVDLNQLQLATEVPADRWLALDGALEKLAKIDPLKAELVKLRFFHGLNVVEVGKALGLSGRTAKRHWNMTRAWLGQNLA